MSSYILKVAEMLVFAGFHKSRDFFLLNIHCYLHPLASHDAPTMLYCAHVQSSVWLLLLNAALTFTYPHTSHTVYQMIKNQKSPQTSKPMNTTRTISNIQSNIFLQIIALTHPQEELVPVLDMNVHHSEHDTRVFFTSLAFKNPRTLHGAQLLVVLTSESQQRTSWFTAPVFSSAPSSPACPAALFLQPAAQLTLISWCRWISFPSCSVLCLFHKVESVQQPGRSSVHA